MSVFGEGLGVRHCQATLTFLCLALAYAMRAGLSVGVVAMTTATGYNQDLPVIASGIQGVSKPLLSIVFGTVNKSKKSYLFNPTTTATFFMCVSFIK